MQELLKELGGSNLELEIALRRGVRMVRRFREAGAESIMPLAREEMVSPQEVGFVLAPTASSRSDLYFVERSQAEPGEREVEIEVKASSLNFRDSLKAIGAYPSEDENDVYLGDECSGVIRRLGPKVTGWQVGDEVIATGKGCIGSNLFVSEGHLQAKPARLNFAQAACIPIAFTTAYYALIVQARLQPGETVLIQAAAGGVGQAALQLAKWRGSRILGTASQKKVKLLRSQGVEHVFDSRSLDFADQVLKATQGQGVDVILNSKAGLAIAKGLEILKPYGRFLEIGKADIFANSQIGLWPFRKNTSFFGIDVADMFLNRQGLLLQISKEIHDLFETGQLQPVAVTCYPPANVRQAFDDLSQYKNVGKTVIDFTSSEPVKVRRVPQKSIFIDQEATYLVTGGNRGFGLAVAHWLAKQGAKHLLLASKSGKVEAENSPILARMRRTAQVELVQLDVCNKKHVERLMEKIHGSTYPLKGILHAATLYDDAPLVELTSQRHAAVMNAKAQGAWNLHKASAAFKLDHFVLFSSISALLGNRGQANYAAANSCLDELAQMRRAHGLAALSINWGALGGVGYLARNQEVAKILGDSGITPLPVNQALECLGALMQGKETQVCTAKINWRRLASVGFPRLESPIFYELLQSKLSLGGTNVNLAAIVMALDEEARLPYLQDRLSDLIGQVLGKEPTGLDRTKPLHAMGIDSLMSYELYNRFRGELGVSLPMTELTKGPNIAELSALILTRLKNPKAEHDEEAGGAIARTEGGLVSLSPAQRRMYLVQQLVPENPLYNLSFAFRLRRSGKGGKPINLALIRKTAEQLLARHEILRCCFRKQGEQLYLHRLEQIDFFRVLDLSTIQLKDLDHNVREECRKPFYLEQGPLFRLLVIKRDEEDYILVCNAHHGILDVWSINLLMQELILHYHLYDVGNANLVQLPESAIQYRDFAAWQNEQVRKGAFQRQLQFWRLHLQGAPQILELPSDFPRPKFFTYRGQVVATGFDRGLQEKVREMAERLKVTPFVCLLALFQLLLMRLSGQSDLIVGTPVANRHKAETSHLVGLMLNSLPLRLNVGQLHSFEELVGRVERLRGQLLMNQEVPFELVVQEVLERRDPSRTPLFQVMFAMPEFQIPAQRDREGLDLEIYDIDNGVAQFDLTLLAVRGEEGIKLRMEYNADLFREETVNSFLQCYLTLLDEVLLNPTLPLERIPLLKAEDSPVRKGWAEPNWAVEMTRGFLVEFEAQAAKTPDAPALRFGQEQWSYLQLNRQANQMARRLRRLAPQPAALAGVMLHPRCETVVALVACFKAGMAFLPLDPDTPPERLRSMLDRAAPAAVITDQELAPHLSAYALPQLLVDSSSVWQEEEDGNPGWAARGQDLAYVMFTSGSTGEPKGVMITCEGLENYLAFACSHYEMNKGRGAILHGSICFDLTVTSIFPPLMSGCPIQIMPRGSDLQDLAREVERIGDLSMLKLTPAHLQMLNLLLANRPWKGLVRTLILGGEDLPRHLVVPWRSKAPSTRVINEYGPTETVVGCCIHEFTEMGSTAGSVEIGRPICESWLYLLDAFLREVPAGGIGEIYIGGKGLARGYLGQPGKTAAAFVPNPYGQPGSRLYKTGDLGRYLPDGRLQYLGRTDGQVKLRGYRIELGEVEEALHRLPGVKSACVVLHTNVAGHKNLNGFYLRTGSSLTEDAALLLELKKYLPDYMIPASLQALDQFPLLSSGKVDRQALARRNPAESRHSGSQPQGERELALAALWQDLLGLPAVYREDDFFALGGDSLLAMRLSARIQAQFQVALNLRQIFESPQLAEMAHCLERGLRLSQLGFAPLRPQARLERLPLSFAQERMWLLQQILPNPRLYSMPFGLRLFGPLDADTWVSGFAQIVQRHAVLRSYFPSQNGLPEQKIKEKGPILEFLDFSQEPEGEAHASETMQAGINRAFALDIEVPLEAKLMRLHPEHHILFLNAHHILLDAWSLDLIGRELGTLAQRNWQGLVPAPELEYTDYAIWQRSQWESGNYDGQLAYWKRQLHDTPTRIDFPSDLPPVIKPTFSGQLLQRGMNPDQLRLVADTARSLGTTPFVVHLALFLYVLHLYSGQRDLVVGIPVANRMLPELENLPGLCLNTLPLRSRVQPNWSFADLVAEVKVRHLEALENQDLPFEIIAREVKFERGVGGNPLFQIMFAFQESDLPLEAIGLSGENLHLHNGAARMEMTLYLSRANDQWLLNLEYAKDLFSAQLMESMVEVLMACLGQLCSHPGQVMASLNHLGLQRNQLLAWGQGAKAEGETSFLQIFEAQAAKTPDAPALRFGQEQWSYLQLNRQANQMARSLLRMGLQQEEGVALLLEAEPQSIAAILAVLKAGGWYLPLDPLFWRFTSGRLV